MRRRLAVVGMVSAVLSGCVSLVAPYDPAFDTSLNKYSEDTAKFIAAASAGGAERNYASQPTVAYYAAGYNLMDRLIARAKLTRGSVPCPTNESLPSFFAGATDRPSRTTLPNDYRSLDCRESQLYSVRFFLDQLNDLHQSDGVLNRSEAEIGGGALQGAILGAIGTFLETKPSENGAS